MGPTGACKGGQVRKLGSHMTFDEFTAARLPALLRFAAVLTGDRGLAEDVTQEVLVRVYERWHRIGGLDAPEHYVRRMIVNEYLTWRRRWGRIQPHAEPPERGDPIPDHAAAHAERDALRTELDKLPRRQRAVLVLRYYAGMSDNEIAEVLGCGAGTVRGYASRALAALRVGRGLVPVKEHS
jgi:RNA polymerase sigma-70 factor (sigma-E family)